MVGEQRFPLGRVVATPSALEVMELHGVDPLKLLKRHASGDWGEVDRHDWRENELSIRRGYRILSAYEVNPTGVSRKLWVITEADRSSTCILLPEEY